MKKKLILFLECDRARALSLQRAFTFEGYDVLAARDGVQALEILLRDPTPDAVVVNLQLEPDRRRLDLLGTVLSRRGIPTILEGAAPALSQALGSWRIDAQVPRCSDFSELTRTVTRVVGRASDRAADRTSGQASDRTSDRTSELPRGGAGIERKRACIPYRDPVPSVRT